MRMLAVDVDLQLAPHRFAEFGLWQHAANRFLDQAGWVLLANVFRAFLAQSALVSAVIAIELLFFLASRHPHARRVHDDDVVAGVDVGRVDGLVLSLEETSSFCRYSTEDLALGVNHVPLPDDTPVSGDKRTHENSLSAFPPSLKP